MLTLLIERRRNAGPGLMGGLRWALGFVLAFSVVGCGYWQPQLIHHQSGRVSSLEALRGQVVLLNFWATWCEPCITEIPVLVDLAEKYGGRVAVVAVFYAPESTGRPLVERWQAKNPAWFTPYIWYGNEGLYWLFPTGGFMPTTYVLDARGDLVEKVRGTLSRQRAQELVEEALARSNP